MLLSINADNSSGFCSREQIYRPEDCAICRATLVGKAGSGFWEGGKGTRNRVLMSRKGRLFLPSLCMMSIIDYIYRSKEVQAARSDNASYELIEAKVEREEYTRLRDGLFSEQSAMWSSQAMNLKVNHILHHEKSKYQDVLVFESSDYETLMVLDNVIHSTERDKFSYVLPIKADLDPQAMQGSLRISRYREMARGPFALIVHVKAVWCC